MLANKLKNLNIRYSPEKLHFGPEWLVMGVNNVCNLHCKMCDVGTKNDQSNFYENLVGTQPLNMPLELIQRVMDEAAQHYPEVKIGYAFTEPMVYPHLIESLQYAKERNLFTGITTNALTLKKNAVALCEAGLGGLYVSLDGPPEIHNHIRGHKSSFQRALEGIELILSQPNPPEVSVFCVITEWNIGHLEEFLTYFSHLPLTQIGFMHTNFTPQHIADQHNLIYGDRYQATASNMDEIDVNKMDLDKMFQEISAIKSSDTPFPISFSPEIDKREVLEDFYHHPEKLFGKRCNDVFTNIMIKSDGSVIPAHGRCYNLTIGNVYQENLKEIWNSRIIGEFRKTLMDAGGLLPACTRCCSAF